MFTSACQRKVSQTTQSYDTANQNKIIDPKASINTSQPLPEPKIIEDNQLPYLGCWSGADNDNTIFHFTEKTVHTSVNKKQIISYHDISRNLQGNGFVLKLKEKDDHNYLQGYLRVSFFKDGEYDGMLVEEFDSIENLENNKISGRIKVYEDDCKKVLWRLKFNKKNNFAS